jgi:hypothetical protein
MVNIRETELYGPVRDYLVAQGYTVRGEVKGCDITAVKGDDLIVVELKRSFSTALLVQATRRQRLADSVYVALLRPAARKLRTDWRGFMHLLRRLELGLIFITLSKGEPLVEVVFHPLPYEPKRNTRGRRAILRELGARSGDYNTGGSHRRKLLTAYREAAIMIACCLEQHGPLQPRRLRALGTGPKTLAILSSNFYRWFERVSWGVYALAPKGRAALEDYPHLVARFRQMIGDSSDPESAGDQPTIASPADQSEETA